MATPTTVAGAIAQLRVIAGYLLDGFGDFDDAAGAATRIVELLETLCGVNNIAVFAVRLLDRPRSRSAKALVPGIMDWRNMA
jgi:hypothetical protein